MTDRYPVAYIRRSTADDSNPGEVSREAQETAVRALAARDGYNGDLHLFVDWGRSADEAKEAKRVAFLSMLGAIERGEVSAVYAFALDRLYRSMRTFVRLTDAARQRCTDRHATRGGARRGRLADGPRVRGDHGRIRVPRTEHDQGPQPVSLRRPQGPRGQDGASAYGLRVVRDANTARPSNPFAGRMTRSGPYLLCSTPTRGLGAS